MVLILIACAVHNELIRLNRAHRWVSCCDVGPYWLFHMSSLPHIINRIADNETNHAMPPNPTERKSHVFRLRVLCLGLQFVLLVLRIEGLTF